MKSKTVYICSECGANYPKWMGKCTTCNSWNTIVEEVVVDTKAAKSGKVGIMSAPTLGSTP